MFYEEKMIDGVLCYRTNPKEKFEPVLFSSRSAAESKAELIHGNNLVPSVVADGYNLVELGPTVVNDSYQGNFATPIKSKYHKQIKGVTVDVYDILVAYDITNPADAHAIKKMLMPGRRGGKDAVTDRKEAILSLERAIQLEEEANETFKKEEPGK